MTKNHGNAMERTSNNYVQGNLNPYHSRKHFLAVLIHRSEELVLNALLTPIQQTAPNLHYFLSQ